MEPALLEPGEMVGPYKIVRKIGHGGMGEVYEAFEENLQRSIAIKMLSKESTSRPDLVSRFKVEGRVLAKLEHRNVVRIHALGEHKGQVYMAMEYVDGWSLDEYLRTHYFGFHEILRLAKQMLEGLAAAHAADVIHRDIKPQNVMVDRQLNTKLLDFGVAKLNEENTGTNTVAGTMFGTLNYIAPELFNGASASKQSDIYSLGLVFFGMFNGKAAFSGRNRLETIEKVANSKITFSPEARAVLPAVIKNIIFKMTAKNPVDRYKSARDALADLNKVNLNTLLPPDLRPALASHMEIECPDELRIKCAKVGLEYLEIRLVVCLAAEITLKSQNWSGQNNIKINATAMTEAVERYVSAKRQMVLQNAYTNSNFKWAAGAFLTVVAFGAYALIATNHSEKPKNVAPATVPVAEVAPAPAVAAPPVVEVPAPEPKVIEEVKANVEEPSPTPEPEVKVVAENKLEPEQKIEAPKPVVKKVKKKRAARVPAAVAKPAAEPAAIPEPAPASIFQQKPVLLPTVIERRGKN